MDSPPKRRRSSNVPGDAAGASHSTAFHDATRRSGIPSFQSPTKSSLARSHPDVLERALSRSPSLRSASRDNQDQTERATSFGLRGRKALRPSMSATSSPTKAPRMGDNAPMLSPSKLPSGIQSFTKPPRRLSKKILPGDFWFGSPSGKPSQPIAQPQSNTPEDQLASELGTATQDANLNEPIHFGLDGADDDHSEPELPPTPTQLGLVKAPEHGAGLLSSSPSARHEKRMKRKAAADITHGSPLKSMKFRHPSPEEESVDSDLTGEDLSAAALERRKVRKSLQAELQRLKDDVEELTQWTEKIESNANLDSNPKELDRFLTLLADESSHINRPIPRQAPIPISSLLCSLLPFSKNIPRPTRHTSPLPTNPFALKQSPHASSYLKVFAPLALQTSTSRSTVSKTNVILETHTLTFTPPPPFPSSLYNVSVVYETNPETQHVVSVSVPTGNDSKKRRVPEVLRGWIESRLANPLLKLDITTLCWGINRYWEVSVARAQLWAYIDHKHGSGGKKGTLPQSQHGVIMSSELRGLIPHLERSTMILQSKSTGGAPRVLLANALAIDDWTGEPQLRPELSVSTSGSGSAMSKKIDQETKKLFHALLREDNAMSAQSIIGGVQFDAIVRATEGAIGALFNRG
ncbi:hypothetical protein N7456_005479 [Penicillium angulare]|uniref:Uncharacterized protein n=1 Tax=Penicillium angulare TaxID=116970 RepID=A0A9W9FYF6_9EURO|nr:hypothetical protein N7456_005479 [Penicillium angulare]